jgi:hypothetical protein
MSSLSLSIELPVSEILVGEKFPVTVVLTNAGAASVEVHNMSRTSGFIFLLYGQNPGGLSYEVSQQQSRLAKMARHGGEVMPSMGKGTLTLKPGESMSPKKENIAAYTDSVFAAGHYQLVVAYETPAGDRIESKPLSVVIRAPQIRQLVSVFCAVTGHFATIFTNQDGNGGLCLYARQSNSSFPSDATNCRLKNGQTEQVSDIAVSCFTVPSVMSRWSLVLEKNTMFGLLENAGISVRTPPLDLDLQDIVMIKPGFELKDQTGVFHACGRSGKTWVVVQIQCLDGKIVLGSAQTIADSQPKFMCISRCKYSGEDSYALFWAEDAGKVKYIRARMLGENGQFIDHDSKVLFETTQSVVGLQTPSLQPVSAPVVSVLTGLPGSMQKLHLARFSYSASVKALETVAIDGPKAPVSSWHLPEPIEGGHVLMVQSEKFLLWTMEGSDGQWRVLAHSDGIISQVQLFMTEPNVYWAQWVDAKTGLHFAQVPSR